MARGGDLPSNRQLEIANLLISLGCLKISSTEPFFTYASGLRGPIYCDNRLVLGHPSERRVIVEAMVATIREKELEFDRILGLAVGGVPCASLVAGEMQSPLGYVLSSAKSHGMKRSVEGGHSSGERVVVVEDLVNQGSSLGKAAAVIKDEGLEFVACVAIVDYQFAASQRVCRDFNIPLYALTTFDAIVTACKNNSIVDEQGEQLLRAWHSDPKHWKP